jgi:membrane-associated phospholipid phosphatase
MYSATNQKGMREPTAKITAGGENRKFEQNRHRAEVLLWIIGCIILVISCFIIHAHPQPYPVDIATTQTLTQIRDVHWASSLLQFPSILNNPLPAAIVSTIWFLGMLLMGGVSKLRGKSPIRWLQASVLLVVAVAFSAGMNTVIDTLVNRPRPSSNTAPIRHNTVDVPYPTFPSGHTVHDLVFYGLLLYLSFTKPVREWHYRWLLIPLQLYAVFDILSIGVSRIMMEDHWVTDVLGGYLEGALELYLCIMLFRWTAAWLIRRRAIKASWEISPGKEL